MNMDPSATITSAQDEVAELLRGLSQEAQNGCKESAALRSQLGQLSGEVDYLRSETASLAKLMLQVNPLTNQKPLSEQQYRVFGGGGGGGVK